MPAGGSELQKNDDGNYKVSLQIKAEDNITSTSNVKVTLTLDVDGQTTNLVPYTVTVKKADDPELITTNIKTFTISENEYSTPIQVEGIGSGKTVKITDVSVKDNAFSITNSNGGLTLSESGNTYATTLSFTASLNNNNTTPTTGTIQLTLQIGNQTKILEYSLTVNNPELDTTGLQTDVTEGDTYTQEFVVKGIIADASGTDPVVKITAVAFDPSSPLSLNTALPADLTRDNGNNNYKGQLSLQAKNVDSPTDVNVTLKVQVGDQTKDLDSYIVTVEPFGIPVLNTSKMKTSATTESKYSSKIWIDGVNTDKESISLITADADKKVLKDITVSKDDNGWKITGKTGTETGDITLTITLQNNNDNKLKETTTKSYKLKLSAPLIVYQPNPNWFIVAYSVLALTLGGGIGLGLRYPNKPVYKCGGKEGRQ